MIKELNKEVRVAQLCDFIRENGRMPKINSSNECEAGFGRFVNRLRTLKKRNIKLYEEFKFYLDLENMSFILSSKINNNKIFDYIKESIQKGFLDSKGCSYHLAIKTESSNKDKYFKTLAESKKYLFDNGYKKNFGSYSAENGYAVLHNIGAKK